MKVIAENNKRSLAKELELIVENHIKEYEAKHGEIIIEETDKDISSESIWSWLSCGRCPW